MRRLNLIVILMFLLVGCASNVNFIQIDKTYVRHKKPKDAEIVYTHDDFERPYRVIGVLQVKVDLDADESEFKELFIKKARKIGADGVVLGKYVVDVDANYQTPYKPNSPITKASGSRWVTASPNPQVWKIVTAVVVVFE